MLQELEKFYFEQSLQLPGIRYRDTSGDEKKEKISTNSWMDSERNSWKTSLPARSKNVTERKESPYSTILTRRKPRRIRLRQVQSKRLKWQQTRNRKPVLKCNCLFHHFILRLSYRFFTMKRIHQLDKLIRIPEIL